MVTAFRVLKHTESLPSSAVSTCFLVEDNWDDWFRFETMYMCWFFDEKGAKTEIGHVKIGQFALPEGQRRPIIPTGFHELPEGFFSLGQDVSYYTAVMKLSAGDGHRFLSALHDLSADQALFDRALSEPVTRDSLLRSVPERTVRGQFKRVIDGGVALTPYQFIYKLPKLAASGSNSPPLDFQVEPDSSPPTNVHVLIGRNGVGKTFVLNRMARSLVADGSTARKDGQFETTNLGFLGPAQLFANIVSVSFSAFDSFQKMKLRSDSASNVGYTYVGLKRSPGDTATDATKSTYMLGTEFANSSWACSRIAKRTRWRRAISILSTEPGFNQENVGDLLEQKNDTWDQTEFKKTARRLFNGLSSGHKIVLLTVTRLVDAVSEKTLVLIDEPESHLHPPLLSAFLRALSDLLVNRNGVAIVATHSPVVLQEVPRRCVWKIRRHGTEVVVERPGVETFGENVGVLLRYVP